MQTEIKGIAMGMNINTWDNGDNNIKLYQAELIDMGSLCRDFAFNIVLGKLEKGSNNLFLTEVTDLQSTPR